MFECRKGAVAPMSDTRSVPKSPTATTRPTRDRITVDLRGLGPALLARSAGQGVSPSDFVRAALADALGTDRAVEGVVMCPPRASRERMRLSLRMRADDVQTVQRAAAEAGMSAGDFIALLVERPPAQTLTADLPSSLRTLTTSCAELATLSRGLHRLSALLRQGSGQATQDYRAMLDGVHRNVHTHLIVVASVVAALRPLVRAGTSEPR